MRNNQGKYLVIGLVVLLVILHQDIWFWDSYEPAFGFMPVALLWHAGISVAASITWFIATKVAWPTFEDDVPVDTAAEATEGSES
ncbi:MAG: DUF3311 domain-containing protein [Pirellulaceae bacterium]|jgi:hypothetical protein|nr:DUF3311 domain-containing protein [Pirellulaceae bacterium]|tara:strand:+ start:427 stop:681 length:255 start_codon:yes stop_codon:yes gene_type:complete